MEESILKFDTSCKRYKQERNNARVNLTEINEEMLRQQQKWSNEKFEM